MTNKKLKVATVVGTRPEIIRLSRILHRLEDVCDHTLIHTGQNYDYELNQVFFEELNLRKPDYFLNCAEGSVSAANTIGNIITSVDKVLDEGKFDSLLVLGDTNSCLAVIPAKRRKIPTFHMEAGNRCFDQRVPEEINRRIVDHTADVNLTYSAIAREYLLREGLPPDLVIKTGSPIFEVLQYYRPKWEVSDVLDRFDLSPENYILVSVHREENIDPEGSFEKIVALLNSLAEEYQLSIIVSLHPRTKKRLYETESRFHPLIQPVKPLGYFDYVQLQTQAKVVLSDSGTINEESSVLGFPALNLRESHERPEGMEETAVMMVGLELDRVLQCMRILENQGKEKYTLRKVPDYVVPNVSEKIVRIIHSYTDYVNRVIWKRY